MYAMHTASLLAAVRHSERHACGARTNGPLVRVQAVQAWGMGMDVESSKRLAQSLDDADLPDDPYFNRIVRIMATRCMTQAKYFSSGTVAPSAFVHYGLAAPIYTHFTSPIRRRAPATPPPRMHDPGGAPPSKELSMHAAGCRK